MRSFILITLIAIHTTTATVDLEQLKHKVATKVETITHTAASTLQKLASSIDLSKLKQFDVLHILPKAKFVHSLVEAKKRNLPKLFAPAQKETLKYYGHSLSGVNVHELGGAFEWK